MVSRRQRYRASIRCSDRLAPTVARVLMARGFKVKRDDAGDEILELREGSHNLTTVWVDETQGPEGWYAQVWGRGGGQSGRGAASLIAYLKSMGVVKASTMRKSRRGVACTSTPDVALSQVSRAMRILDQAIGNVARSLDDPEQEFYDEMRSRWSQIERQVGALIRLARSLSR